MARDPGIGNRVVATVKSIKGTCSAGHQVGDSFELCGHNSDGLCGFFYHDIFADIVMMQMGGGYPWSQNKDLMLRGCRDRNNQVELELHRLPRT